MLNHDLTVQTEVGGKKFMTPEVMAGLASRGINDVEAGFTEHWNMRRPRLTDDAKVLRADSVPDRVWRELDSTVVRIHDELTPAHMSLPQVNVMNPVGTFEVQVPRVDRIGGTFESLHAAQQGETDKLDFDHVVIPLPWTWIDLAFPAALEESWTPYMMEITSQAINEVMFAVEKTVFNGLKGTYGGREAKGFANTSVGSATANGAKWNTSSKTGAQYETDMIKVITELTGDRQYGPIQCFLHPTAGVQLARSYSTQYPKTIRERLLEGFSSVMVSTGISTAANAYFVSPMQSTVRMAMPISPRVMSWLDPSGFTRHVRVYAKAAPVFVPDANGKIGAYIIN